MENAKRIDEKNINKNDKHILFTVMINTEIVLNICVKDNMNFFETSKHFYINFSYCDVNKSQCLLIPGFWEIYCPYNHHHTRNLPKLLLFSALLDCQTIEEIKKILKKLDIFSNEEIKNILKIITKNI